jgi:hypothetical protein
MVLPPRTPLIPPPYRKQCKHATSPHLHPCASHHTISHGPVKLTHLEAITSHRGRKTALPSSLDGHLRKGARMQVQRPAGGRRTGCWGTKSPARLLF